MIGEDPSGDQARRDRRNGLFEMERFAMPLKKNSGAKKPWA